MIALNYEKKEKEKCDQGKLYRATHLVGYSLFFKSLNKI